MQPFQAVLPQHARRPLCTYFSQTKTELLNEVREAYRACRSSHTLNPESVTPDQLLPQQLLALVVPHGAACDGFFVAAAAYRRLAEFLYSRHCRHLTAVLLGTEHRGTTPVALSRQDWLTPLGVVPVNRAAVDHLQKHFSIPVNEAPHDTEHSIENQLPFLVHGAACGWDLAAAGCSSDEDAQPGTAAATAAATTTAATVAAAGSDPASAAMGHEQSSATLSIVPISVGYLGQQTQTIEATGAAIRSLLTHLRQENSEHCQQQEQQQQQQQQQQQHPGGTQPTAFGKGSSSGGGGSSDGSSEVVLIVTSDFTHAGPWYRELPPQGVSLEAYMRSQDMPVLQAVQQGSAQALLSAAADTHNSMCGLYPLAIALEALYGSNNGSNGGGCGSSGSNAGSSRGSNGVAAAKPVLLDYKPAHLIFDRPDSTGFAAFAVYAR